MDDYRYFFREYEQVWAQNFYQKAFSKVLFVHSIFMQENAGITETSWKSQ